ncbi:MAG TPA: metal-dependent hydrolase [Anaerolineales bacterium]|nr:metal-dependent hydrolase [Anaerolineales bacterium]
MAQNGLHAITGMLVRKWMPQRDWLPLGLVLGNMAPDLDNLTVAYATLTGADSHGLHRTFTHSIFTVSAVILLFYLLAVLTKNGKWNNFGIGFGSGILTHSLLDLLIWFNGVEVLWPIRYELNFWSDFTPPGWLRLLLDSGEFLGFGLYFLLLSSLAQKNNTDQGHRSSARMWMYTQFALFPVFTVLFLTLGAEGILYIVFGALYLLSLIAAMTMTIRMRRTVETVS